MTASQYIPVRVGFYYSDEELCMQDIITQDDTFNFIKVNWLGRNLTGQIPSNLGFLECFKHLDLFDNLLSGTLPSNLRFAPLILLDMSRNNITGVTPPALCMEKLMEMVVDHHTTVITLHVQ